MSELRSEVSDNGFASSIVTRAFTSVQHAAGPSAKAGPRTAYRRSQRELEKHVQFSCDGEGQLAIVRHGSTLEFAW